LHHLRIACALCAKSEINPCRNSDNAQSIDEHVLNERLRRHRRQGCIKLQDMKPVHAQGRDLFGLLGEGGQNKRIGVRLKEGTRMWIKADNG